MMRVYSHPDADSELDAAVFYYEECSVGLGDDFIIDFEKTLSRIKNNPTRYRIIKGMARILKLKRFPYSIVYEFHGDNIYILAITHDNRRPLYWSSRSRPQ
jgi:hypothetical protein